MNTDDIRYLAKKSFIALQNPYHSVVKVYPQIIDKVSSIPFSYVGVKNRPEIPHSLLDIFEATGRYGLHTIDNYSLGGRAIDVKIKNPITGSPMTGSSSGTAINVLTGINDLGIGTDGGGSVLAPAMSLNLFSFISPAICKEHTSKFVKHSTDSHSFTPSIGFITREFEELKQAIQVISPNPILKDDNKQKKILILNDIDQIDSLKSYDIKTAEINLNNSRESLITFLEKNLTKYDMILSKEGPVDFQGLGDTVLGHMGNKAVAHQHKGNKGLIRVANMAGAAAVTIPTRDHATSCILLCNDSPQNVWTMLELASKLSLQQDELLKQYFMNFDHYFSEEFR
ncbi:amidase family protein [Alkalibacterium kapii]|uniref:Uncharacterized protein n=1 Tax=Alkalibacterium kapii TaxID=426704 RepID=A0A511AVH6_9LACT|nr:amidase family protein [Alkalibacterium kapii]GEK92144.1 hypothetical protein AKA01nite_17660 [Alkalibacterium kapii]